MKLKFTVPFFLMMAVISLSLKNSNAQKPSDSQNKISPHVLDFFSKTTTSDQELHAQVLVFLKKQTDLSFVRNLPTRQEKLNAVYKALTKTALTSQANILSELKKQKLSHKAFYITNMIAVNDITSEQVQKLAERADVARITLNPQIKNILPAGVEIKADRGPQWIESNLAAIGADKVWTELGVAGENIVVAGQDTGVEWDHPALKSQYRGNTSSGVDHNYNWHDSIATAKPGNLCGSNAIAPCDDNAHGTHTVGTMVGDDRGGNQIGVAPKAKWIACRNMDAGEGTPARYMECFEFFLAPYKLGGNSMTDGKPELAPHIINNSWSCPTEEGCEGDEFLPILKALKTAGIMVIVSAGNSGSNCSTINAQPATHTGITFTVGAHDHSRDSIAFFSSRGPSTFDNGGGPDVVAPGVNIRSSVPGKKYEQSGWSGTSMAGPHVAGLVALMWSKNPELIGKIDETSEILQKTATAKVTTQSCGGISGSTTPNNTYGYGLVNSVKAVSK